MKNPPANAGDGRWGFNPWVRRIPWSRKWQPAPVLPGKFYGQRSSVGYSPQSCKELNITATEFASAPARTHTQTQRCVSDFCLQHPGNWIKMKLK